MPGALFLVALATAAFLFHALTASSGLFWLDAGDFVTAGFDLGVPHPTGYPLYILLGRLVCCLPLGPVSFRFSLLSALTSGVATALIMAVVYRLGAGRGGRWTIMASLVAVLALWATEVGGLLGRTPDVYALHMALVAAAVLLGLRLIAQTNARDVLLLGFVVGLGMSNHAEFRLFAPIFLALLVTVLVKTPSTSPVIRRSMLVLGWLAMVFIGLVPYVYLPLAASRQPYHLWGHPDTWERFVNHVWGLTIRLAHQDSFLNLTWPHLTRAIELFSGQIWQDWRIILFLSAWGLVVVARANRIGAAFLVLLVAADWAYAILFNPMGLSDDQNGATLYLILAVLAAVGLAHGLGWLADRWSGRSAILGRSLALALVSVVLLVVAVRANPERLFLNGSWGAEDLTFEGIARAPTGALVLSDSEGFVAARLYLVGVGALRPDLQVLNRPELSDSLLLVQRSRSGPYPLAGPEVLDQWSHWGVGASEQTYRQRLSFLLDQAFQQGRAVLWGGGRAQDSQGRFDRIDPGFPLHRIHPRPAGENGNTASWDQLVPSWFTRHPDPWGRRWLADYLNWLGTYYTHRDRPDLATQIWMSAVEQAPDWSPPLVNLGVLAARGGAFDRAEALADMAVSLDPLNHTAWLNLARYRCVLGRIDNARQALARAEALRAPMDKLMEVRALLQQCPGGP